MTKGQKLWLMAFAVVGALLVTINVSGQQAGQLPQISQAALRAEIATQDQYHAQLVSHPLVIGTGVSVDASGRGVIKVYTTAAGARGIPTTLDGVPVVVQNTGPFVALQGRGNGGSPPGGGGGGGNGGGRGNGGGGGGGGDAFDRTARHRPSPIGVSVGHPDITAGTIGARVVGPGGDLYILSNNHVLANVNQANILDPILQPGAYDGGTTPADDVARLSAYIALLPGLFDINRADAAIAAIDTDPVTGDPLVGNATPADGYGLPRTMPINAAINMSVMKYGRTTGLTTGVITDLSVDTIVQYGYDYYLAFYDQILVSGSGFSAGGDSGSVVVVAEGADARRPVGLLFAGGSGSTLMNPIGIVLNAFGVTIDGES